jgi:hypothetical protein
MANGDSLPDQELVIRRFDPTNASHFTTDDAGLPARLRQSALRFDDMGGPAGCSVYQDSKLGSMGLARQDCVEATNAHWQLAGTTAGTVRSVKRVTVPNDNPFDVVEDAYPEGLPAQHPRDGAHALVTHGPEVPGSDKWYQVLAFEFTVKAANV